MVGLKISTAFSKIKTTQKRGGFRIGVRWYYKKIIYDEVPLRVEYELTDFGEGILPVMVEMNKLGMQTKEKIKVMRSKFPIQPKLLK